MALCRRQLIAACLAALLGALIVLAQPEPPRARANVACDVGSAPADAVSGGLGAITGGAVGGGNPVGDACNAVTDGAVGAITSPIKSAVAGIGNGIFNQITSWVTDGASWLISQVVSLIEKTTTPKLTTKGFISQYRRMAEIAALLATAMLLFAVLEGLAQGNAALLGRAVLVNLPLAFIASSVAYLVVQMLITATDGLSHAIAVSTNHNSEHFFRGAIHGLSKAGGSAGAAAGTAGAGPGVGTAAGGAGGAVAAPLFVTFLAAIIGAFAAFFVWIELLMRDAAIYVVALFAPMALAASIWPRWSGALRRTGELLVVVIVSKFVIVAIISLAAGLLSQNDGQVEHILAAAALMLLACFAPFVLIKLVPFAEGAMAAAYGRHSAAGTAVSGAQLTSSAAVMRNAARAQWGSGGGAQGGGGAPGGQNGGAPGGARSGLGGGARGSAASPAGGGAEAGGSAAGAAGGAVGVGAAAVAAPVAAARASKAAAGRLGDTATAEAAGAAGEKSSAGAGGRPAGEAPARPTKSGGGSVGGPQQAEGGKAPGAGNEPPRPAPEVKAAKPGGKGSA